MHISTTVLLTLPYLTFSVYAYYPTIYTRDALDDLEAELFARDLQEDLLYAREPYYAALQSQIPQYSKRTPEDVLLDLISLESRSAYAEPEPEPIVELTPDTDLYTRDGCHYTQKEIMDGTAKAPCKPKRSSEDLFDLAGLEARSAYPYPYPEPIVEFTPETALYTRGGCHFTHKEIMDGTSKVCKSQ